MGGEELMVFDYVYGFCAFVCCVLGVFEFLIGVGRLGMRWYCLVRSFV